MCQYWDSHHPSPLTTGPINFPYVNPDGLSFKIKNLLKSLLCKNLDTSIIFRYHRDHREKVMLRILIKMCSLNYCQSLLRVKEWFQLTASKPSRTCDINFELPSQDHRHTRNIISSTIFQVDSKQANYCYIFLPEVASRGIPNVGNPCY